MLVTALPGLLGHSVMYILSHAGDGAAGGLGHDAMFMPSHAGDNAAKSCR
jgi:hypothetical protein